MFLGPFLGDVAQTLFEAATGLYIRFDEPGSVNFVWKDGPAEFPYDH